MAVRKKGTCQDGKEPVTQMVKKAEELVES